MKKLQKLSLKELILDPSFCLLDNELQDRITGGEITVVFDRSDGLIYIYNDGECLASFDAANNVSSSSNGNWPNGSYSMLDTNNSHFHGSNSSQDTTAGAYGAYGIYRAENFPDGSCTRTGMGLHSGRNDNYEHPTMGCIRTTDEAMEYLDCAIGSYGPFTSITVQE